MENEYPKEIISNTSFRDRMDLKEVYASRPCHTQRTSPMPAKDCLDSFGEVTAAALGQSIIGMSVNMMDTPYLPEYGYWVRFGDGAKYWDFKEVDFSKYSDDCKYDPELTLIYLNASKIEGAEIPYKRKFADRNGFEKFQKIPGIFDDGTEFSRADEYGMTATVRHLHEPTFLNYFHAEIWLTHGDVKVKDLKDKPEWKAKLTRLFLEFIRANAKLDCPGLSPIPESEYSLESAS